jgi:Ser/Thr protein kinase RdoA (MazF antagonist)
MVNDRERFSPGELAAVLKHYNIGEIVSAREYARGSRHAPKLLIRTDGGAYLLKRRAVGRDVPERVEFSHELMRHLRRERFPAPILVATSDAQGSHLLHEGRIYELFAYLAGERYDESLPETHAAGRTLAKFHASVTGLASRWQPRPKSYHDSPAVRQSLNSIPTTAGSHDSVIGREAELLGMTQELYERYDDAANAVNALGWADWPGKIVHGDWHPGNLLFARSRVCAVLDFDSARPSPRIVDVANGMLQFSILRGGGDPGAWPEFFDLTRMRRFHAGYLARGTLEVVERQAIPHLMIESLIAECAFPIAVTGSLGAMPGFGVLQMVRRKIHWLLNNLEHIRTWLLD